MIVSADIFGRAAFCWKRDIFACISLLLDVSAFMILPLCCCNRVDVG